MSRHESEELSPDPGTARPVLTPDAIAVKRGGSGRKRHGFTQPLTEPERALSKDAEAQARQLRREHRALYTADSRRLRRIVRAAQSAVFR